MENTRKDFTSLHGFLHHAAHELHDLNKEFLFHKVDKEFKGITFETVLQSINEIAAFLLSLGLKKGDRCALVLENCPQYVYFDQALMKLGLVNVSIYPTLTAEETKYILTDSGAKTLLVGTPFLLKKYQKIAADLPEIIQVITLFDDAPENEKFISFKKMLQKGHSLLPTYQQQIDEQYKQVSANDLATLIYTSGNLKG